VTSRRKVLLGGVGALALGAGGLAGRRWFLSREPEARPAIDGQGRVLWSNWAGNAHSYPAKRVAPASEADLITAMGGPKPIRPVGSGHSVTALVPTEGTLLSLDRLSPVLGRFRSRQR
jgi:hypothetical protein